MTPEEEALYDSVPHEVAKPEGNQTGFPGYTTDEQNDKVKELRALLIVDGYEERLDDFTLLRFLRARQFEVDRSHRMFQRCEKWRKEFGTNTVLEDFVYVEKAKVAKLYPQYYHKTDKDGRPVYYEELGKVNIPEMYKITTQDRMLKQLVWEYENFALYRLSACSRKAGVLVETSCTILDLAGISISSVYQVFGYVKAASNIGQNYYPERMGKFYMINAPFGFPTAFRMFKPFLDPVTISKIFILGSNYQDDLLKQIPAENLPVKFGGKSEVSEQEGGLYLSDAGPWRDAQYVGPEGLGPEPKIDADGNYSLTAAHPFASIKSATATKESTATETASAATPLAATAPSVAPNADLA